MHFDSDACVCGVHCVMAKGVHTDGIVLAKFSCTEPNFKADGVVLLAVPDKGLTYLTRFNSCANAPAHVVDNSINKKNALAFNIITNRSED